MLTVLCFNRQTIELDDDSEEKKDGLTDKEKIVSKNIGKYLKKLNNDLKKLQKYQDNITYGLDYLFNEEDYYKLTEVKYASDGNYVLY